MSKDPTPRADGLQAMREARYGHLQATAEPAAPKPRKLIPFAGKETKGIVPKDPAKPAHRRARVKRKRRTELPPEKET